ncbi:hypothetical protein HMPREF9970_2582 [Lachnoanaerobaculum saburreum F0468]|uniref:Uncharacterized protein n=1 Tax=Lachnoanaerobaculum saburreum F0468 TaxID=1095750 RepID=I0R9T0_9FIRM|nr:hypothetical protein HMPREF9970_2582 [Lachnoanaerobaculum saburreum F0468]
MFTRWVLPAFFIEISFFIIFFLVYIIFIYDRIEEKTS